MHSRAASPTTATRWDASFAGRSAPSQTRKSRLACLPMPAILRGQTSTEPSFDFQTESPASHIVPTFDISTSTLSRTLPSSRQLSFRANLDPRVLLRVSCPVSRLPGRLPRAPTMSPDQPSTLAAGLLIPTAAPSSRSLKRPLRTYGRRSAGVRAQEQEEPQTDIDRRATTPDLQNTLLDRRRASLSPQLPVLPENNQAERPSRGSILAYFKPLPPSSDKAPSDVVFSGPPELPSTPPTPPTPPSRSRKRRRLTTRPQFGGLGEHLEDDGEDAPEDDQDSTIRARIRSQRSSSTGDTTIVVGIEACDPLRPALIEVTANSVDYQDAPLTAEAATTRAKRPTQKRQRRDMTQTTLSLSIQKEPGFTICGVCDILYNPLNEKDRREHNRRHAAYSRNKKRAS